MGQQDRRQSNGTHPDKTQKRKKKVESTLGDLQDNIKQNNICIIEFTRRGKERGRKFI